MKKLILIFVLFLFPMIAFADGANLSACKGDLTKYSACSITDIDYGNKKKNQPKTHCMRVHLDASTLVTFYVNAGNGASGLVVNGQPASNVTLNEDLKTSFQFKFTVGSDTTQRYAIMLSPQGETKVTSIDWDTNCSH